MSNRNLLSAQLFNLDDILYWIAQERHFGKQTVFLDDMNKPSEAPGPIDDGQSVV